MKDNTCSIIIGRFNPLTTYHKSIIRGMSGQKFVMTTSSHDHHRNPLPPSMKLQMLEDTFRSDPTINVMLCKDVIDALFVIGIAVKDAEIILHCGSDRGDDYQRLNRYTDQAGVTIKEVIIHDRASEEHSATFLRKAAVEQNRAAFDHLCGFLPEHKEMVYDLIQRYASV